MRILVVSQYFWPENFRINDWVDGMIERGHEVTVLTSLPNYPKGVLYEDYKKCPANFNNYKNVEIIRVPQVLRGSSSIKLFLNYISFAFFGSTVGVWKLRGKQFDASFVFAISPILMVIPAIAIKFFKKIPILLWVLDLWPDVLRSTGVVKSERLLYYLSKGVAYLYSKCDCVVAQSNMFLIDIRKLVPTHKNVLYLPSWSEKIIDNKYDFEIDNLIKLKKSDFNIFYTGNIGDAQDFPTIIEAAKKTIYDERIKWFIVGDGRMLAYLKEAINSNQLEKNVFLLGEYAIDKMAVLFKYASVALLCLKKDESLSKTIPGKFQTYCAYGLPIVGACDGEIYAIVNQNNIGIICNAGDSNALSNNILELKKLGVDNLNKMGENGKKYYFENFDRDTILQKFEAELIKLIR